MRERRRFSVWLNDGSEMTLVERRKIIDTTTQHNRVYRSEAEGNKPYFFTVDGHPVEEIENGVYDLGDGRIARESRHSN